MSEQAQLSFAPDTVSRRIPYRGQAPHNGTPTSQQAAESVEIHKGSLQWKLNQHFRRMGGYGCTDEEGADALGISGNTYRPRRRELEEMGFVKRTRRTRPTKSGRSATVFVAVR